MSTIISRRTFLTGGALAGGGLALGFYLGPRLIEDAHSGDARQFPINAWVRIGADDQVTLLLSQTEIGQGISTTLPAILCDELGADWDRIRVENSPVGSAYQNPPAKWMFTGNSESTKVFAAIMTSAGAAAREMLTNAAAARWEVNPAECRTERGRVLHRTPWRRLTFGEVAEAASKLPVPQNPRPRPASELKLVGRAVPRRDIPSKVDGTAVFGIDVKRPGMAHAAVRQTPALGGTVVRYDAASVTSRPGVIAVVEIPGGLAVIAEHWWQAKVAADAMEVTFAPPQGTPASSDNLAAQYRSALETGPWASPTDEEEDEIPTATRHGRSWAALSEKDQGPVFAAAAAVVTEEYESPFQAHAAMEPMNCTAEVTEGTCRIWAPTQGPEMTRMVAAKTLGLSPDAIEVNWTLSGGGFGRRLLADFVAQAVLCARAVGRPVKVIWTREEDMTHDFYRPATLTRISAAVGADGKPLALAARLVSPTQLQPVSAAPLGTIDPRAIEGLEATRYAIPKLRLDYHKLEVAVPTSVLRTTGYGPNVFVMESMIDELAARAGADPYRYRRELLAGDARALRVLDAAARAASWSEPVPAGRSRGIAFCDAFGTLLAQVVELSVDRDKAVRVHRVTSAADPGRVFDPGIGASNIEGGVVWGLTSAFKSEVTFADGACVPRNFDGYDVTHLWETPRRIDTVLIDGDPGGALGGLGEVGPVTVVPALTNALFAATGERVRTLPLSRHGYTPAYENLA